MFTRYALRGLSSSFVRLQIGKAVSDPFRPSVTFSRYLHATLQSCRFEEPLRSTESTANAVDHDDQVNTNLESYVDKAKAPRNFSNIISRKDAIQLLSDVLLISPKTGEKIFQKEQRLRFLNSENFRKVVDLIQTYGISPETVEEYPWILAMQSHILRNKLETVSQMNARKIDDLVPLLRVSNFRLTKILCIMQQETTIIPDGNRIYYLANKLNLKPHIASKYISTRLFMLEIPVQTLVANLDAMLDYGVAPISIIRDLWAFRYTTTSILERLERAKRAQKEKLMPWMIRCPEPILQKSLKLALDEKKILGKNDDIYDYLSRRLGFDIETTKGIVSKHPAVSKIRATKIKEVLDYLLEEAGFTRFDVAKVPRILSHGLATTKHRLEELKSHGCIPSSLVIVCKSQREYKKFLNQWNATRNKINKQQNL